MANDDALQATLAAIAAQSQGELTFESRTLSQFAKAANLQLSRSPNPVYIFTVSNGEGTHQTCVAYTLTLDGAGRPATRAEALGRSVAQSDGELFAYNPILIAYDYTGERILAVSAFALFGAFAERAKSEAIPFSGTSSFSLTPNFDRGTINMYVDLRSPEVWASSAALGELDADELKAFLRRTIGETTSGSASIPKITEAIRTRIAATPPDATTPIAGSTPADSNLVIPVQTESDDDSVRVDDRLWQIILTAVASSPAVLLVGPPGTGKSALLRKAIAAVSRRRVAEGMPALSVPLWATPDESWTARELIGGETIDRGEIVFRPGWVLRAIAEGRWLVLDEANRGDLDKIFGALLTWLAGGEVTVAVDSSAPGARLIELGWTNGESRVETDDSVEGEPGRTRYLASKQSWRMVGTYNALDAQRVFRIGAALGRRFVRVPIPPLQPADFDTVLNEKAGDLNASLRSKIAKLYLAHFDDERTRLGPAHFLGMCSYMRAAVVLRSSGAGRIARDADGREHEAGESRTSEASHAASVSSGTEDDTGADTVDAATAEAYLLNLGTHLAQLEEPDLEKLLHRIQTAAALTSEDILWVAKMIRALA